MATRDGAPIVWERNGVTVTTTADGGYFVATPDEWIGQYGSLAGATKRATKEAAKATPPTEGTDMAGTARKATTRTAAAAKAAPTKATPTRKAAPKAAAAPRKAAAPKAAAAKATPTKATRTKASASAVAKAAAKADPKAELGPLVTKESDVPQSQRYAWGERTKEAGYAWGTAEAEKLAIDVAESRTFRLHQAKAEILRSMAASGVWHVATKDRRLVLTPSDVAELRAIVADFDTKASWRVRGKENGWKQAMAASQRARRLVMCVHIDTSPKVRAGMPHIDVWTWESDATKKAKAKAAAAKAAAPRRTAAKAAAAPKAAPRKAAPRAKATKAS